MKTRNIICIALCISAMMCVGANAGADEAAKERRLAEKTLRNQKKELYRKSDKMVLKEAKKLEKEGWKTNNLPIAKMLEQTWEREFQYDEEGYPKYIYVTVDANGGSYSAAQMQCENVAKVRIASNIMASVASLSDVALANNEISPKCNASLSKAVENAKVIVSGKLGRVFPSLTIYKCNKNQYTVREIVLYDMRQAMNIVQGAMTQELKDESAENKAQLEKLLGMGNLVDSYERNNTEN